MSVTASALVEAKLVEDVTTTQYTVTGTAAIIDKFTGTNISAGAVSLSVYLVASGANASSTNRIMVDTAISAGATYTFPELTGHILVTGDFISTIASAPNALVLRVSGRVVS
jgi:hypothetical protein